MIPKTAQILGLFSLFAVLAVAAPKERNWQDGKILDLQKNRYFTKLDLPGQSASLSTSGGGRSNPGEEMDVHGLEGSAATVSDYYVVEGADIAYLAVVQRLKSFPAARVTFGEPIRFAVEKNKLWFLVDDRKEYETKILKQVETGLHGLVTQAQPAAPVQSKAAPEKLAAPKPAPDKPTHDKEAKVEAPAMAKSIVAPAPAPKDKDKSAQLPVQTPNASAKEQAKETTVSVKPTPKPEPAPAKATAAQTEAANRPALKDRPWQSGHLLSTGANPFFNNVPFTTDMDGGSWTFVQAADGKINVTVRAVSLPTNPFTFDDYTIETEFCVYLVQHQRPKTNTPVRFNGAAALRIAIEKSRIWMIDDEGKEIEMKIVKQLQREELAVGPKGAQTAAR